MSTINEVFERLYAEAIYSGSLSACKRDMNDDLELIEAELCRLRAEAELARELAKAAHVVARLYGETLCQGNEGREFMDAVDALFPKEADE